MGAETVMIESEGSREATEMARALTSHRGRRRRHVIKDLPRNLGDLDISGARAVGADEGRPEGAPKDAEESDGSVCTEETG